MSVRPVGLLILRRRQRIRRDSAADTNVTDIQVPPGLLSKASPDVLFTRENLYLGGIRRSRYGGEMNLMPFLADYIWIGGGTLGTILVIVLIVYFIRRA
jgi:hypothetical protein